MIYFYLIKNYLKIFFICLFSFVTLLLVIRLEEIARFAALGAEKKDLFLFLTSQIPFILPFALAIATLLASTLFFRYLSLSQELTALRSSGLSLARITYPLIFTSFLLGILSFALASEIATRCHLKTKEMVYSFTSRNPIILLSSRQLPLLKGAIVQMTKPKKGRAVGDLLIAYAKNDALFLVLGSDLVIKEQHLCMGHATGLFFSENKSFVLDNQNGLETSSIDLVSLLFPMSYHLANDHLTLSQLRVKIQELKEDCALFANKKKSEKKIEKCKSEIARRCSLAVAPITFTLMGIFFGMKIGRRENSLRFAFIALLAAFTLTTYFMAKSYSHHFWIAAIFYLSPHILITILSYLSYQKINKGIV